MPAKRRIRMATRTATMVPMIPSPMGHLPRYEHSQEAGHSRPLICPRQAGLARVRSEERAAAHAAALAT